MKIVTSEINNLVEAYDRALNEGDAQVESDNLIISDTLAVVEGIYEMTVISRRFSEKKKERGKYVTIF